MFKEICEFIADQTGFVKGTTLQVGHRAQGAPDRCILVSESAGGSTNFYLTDMVDFNIQIVTRAAKNYFHARDDAWLVYDALHGTAGWNLPKIKSGDPDYQAVVIEAITIPQYIGQDENGRYEFSVNFIFRMREGFCEG